MKEDDESNASLRRYLVIAIIFPLFIIPFVAWKVGLSNTGGSQPHDRAGADKPVVSSGRRKEARVLEGENDPPKQRKAKESRSQRRVRRLLEQARREDRHATRERSKWTKQINHATTVTLSQQSRHDESITKFASIKRQPSLLTRAKTEDGATEAQNVQLWSYRTLARPTPPELPPNQASWCRNEIDQFVMRRLSSIGLSPNTAAAEPTLLRRASFDITGLPPTLPSNVDVVSFSFEEKVNSLLDEPTFGEHWARMWLDLTRYADSNGYEEDEMRDKAYPYRDFVIWALNMNLPFDRFVRWQVAGDELMPNNPMAVAATGFLTTAPFNTFFPQESERMDELDSIVSTYGSAILGVTIGCARCHDHKYDDITSREYYRLIAIFAETERTHSYLVPDRGRSYRRFYDPVETCQDELDEMQVRRIKEDRIQELDYLTESEKAILRKPIDPQDSEQARLISICERCLLVTDEQLDDEFEPLPIDHGRYVDLCLELESLEEQLPDSPPTGLTITGSKISTTAVLENGDLKHKEQAEQVGPGFLSAISDSNWARDAWKLWAPDLQVPKPRSALAHWTTDTERGAGALIARVIVNRIWQQYFGQGLVTTPGDFGVDGALPSHPELLEWLAAELVAKNWSLKHIHRLILNSATYQQDSTTTPQKQSLDPENTFLSRHVPRRISAETMRDAMLFVSGNLNTKMYGPGVQPPMPRDAVLNTQDDAEDTWPIDYELDREALWRRGIYIMLKRTMPVPMLRLFDGTDGSISCQQRKTTTLPTQALALLNSHFVLRQSKLLAERVAELQLTAEQQVEQLIRLAYQRSPTTDEKRLYLQYLREPPLEGDAEWPRKKLESLCQTLFMSNEFFYIE